MLQPIQKDHETICPGCGCVLQNIEPVIENPHQSKEAIVSTDIYLLGSAIENNVRSSIRKSPGQCFDEQALKKIETLVSQYNLPTRFILETFKSLKRTRWGIRSETEYIKHLIKILSKDENYVHIKTLQKIKARYEELRNS